MPRRPEPSDHFGSAEVDDSTADTTPELPADGEQPAGTTVDPAVEDVGETGTPEPTDGAESTDETEDAPA